MAMIANDTFWNRERKKKGWTLDYISKKTGIAKSTLGSWFSGAKAPRDDRYVHILCNIFGVPFDTGYNEFYRAEKSWDSSRKTLHYYKTFWNDLREANNLSLEDVSQLTGITIEGVSRNFSGKNVPRMPAIEKYCKLFDIPVEQGVDEFKKAHEAYIAIKNGEEAAENKEETEVKPEVVNAESEVVNVEPEVANVEADIDYTFWPSLFANSMFNISDLAEYLCDTSENVEKYFTGELKIADNKLKLLCSLYGGVDPEIGRKAFNLLNTHYSVTHLDEIDKDTGIPVTSIGDLIEEVSKCVYNAVSYVEFESIPYLIINKHRSVLACIYGNVPYDLYKRVEALVNT